PTAPPPGNYSASEDDAGFSVNLLAGASDPDASDVLSVSGLTLVSGDAAGITPSGNSLAVNPAAYNYLAVGENVVIVYSYDIIDGHGGSVPQTATITITGVNDTPTAVNDSYSTSEDEMVSGNVLANDSDPDT